MVFFCSGTISAKEVKRPNWAGFVPGNRHIHVVIDNAVILTEPFRQKLKQSLTKF